MRPLLPVSLLVGGLSLLGCSGDDSAAAAPGGGSGGASGSGGSGQSGTGGSAGASDGGGGDAGASGSGGSGQSGAGGSAGASDGGKGDAGAGGNAGASDGGGADADASESGDSGAAPKAGYIGVVSYATDVATVFTNVVNAGFNDGPGNGFAKGCQRQVVGACWIALCDYTNGGDQTPPPGAAQSAGSIAVGGTTPAFSLAYDASTMLYGVVPTVPTDKLLFAGGSTITFTAAGAAVAAFTDSLVAPSPLTVTSPVLPSGAFSIDSSKDLVFVWTGSSVGMLSFNVRTTTTSGTSTVAISFVSCQFAASALTGTIPTSLLQQLHKTDATTTALLGTDLSNTKEAVAGDHVVHLAVGSAATQADGRTQYAASQVTIF